MTTAPTKGATTFTVDGGSFVVREGGIEFRPHEGEELTFVSRVRPADMARVIKLQSADLNDADVFIRTFTEIRDFLLTRIVSTAWTDDEGEPYAGVEEMLDDASIDELGFLLQHVVPDRSAAEKGEGSTPSTAP